MISRRLAALLAGLCLTVSGARALNAADVTIYTDYYPPYSEEKDGQIVGLATDLVRQVMAESGLSYDIKLVPWNRAYQLATKLDNVMIYSLLRTSGREARFHWLVPVVKSKLYLYGVPDYAATFDPAKLGTGKIRGVCVIGDIGCTLLKELGIPEHSIIVSPDTYRSEDRVVLGGRADVFIAQERYSPLHSGGAKPEQPRFVKLMAIKDKMRFFFAAGRQVRPDLVAAVRTSYEKLRATGQIQPIDAAD